MFCKKSGKTQGESKPFLVTSDTLSIAWATQSAPYLHRRPP